MLFSLSLPRPLLLFPPSLPSPLRHVHAVVHMYRSEVNFRSCYSVSLVFVSHITLGMLGLWMCATKSSFLCEFQESEFRLSRLCVKHLSTETFPQPSSLFSDYALIL